MNPSVHGFARLGFGTPNTPQKDVIYIRTKEKRFEMRLSNEDYELLSKQAQRTGMSMSAVMLSGWKGIIIKDLPPVEYNEMIIQLRRVGSNINQLLKLANAKGIIIADELRKALEENRKIEKALWNAVTPEKL